MKNSIKQKKKKLCWAIARAEPRAANEPTMAAMMKARFRPIRFISRAAGMVNRATPTTMNAMGSVAHAGEGASSEPTIPPASRARGPEEKPSAWHRLNRNTFLPNGARAYNGRSAALLSLLFTFNRLSYSLVRVSPEKEHPER